ncbi:hypothetical protein AX16_000475 [Volvariella volvacea WC 439]|nr:hypothetical protein AX16_000475 [Volvariella volvacea WC 439]
MILSTRRRIAQAAFSLLALSSFVQLSEAAVFGSTTPSRRATVCNGHAELCEKSYGAVSYVGAHNSYAIGVNNLAVNQDQPITRQLDDGIRLLQSQAHLENGVITLCHTSCALFNGGTLEDYLRTVKTWLDANPNEVLTLLIVNSDNVPASQYDVVFQAAGLDAISFAPESSPLPAASWPTLGSMIDSGRRLVTFLDNGADPSIPYLIDGHIDLEFSNVWETAFNVVDQNLFDCTVDRFRGDTSTQLFLINHFLDRLVLGQPVPDIDRANITNAATGFGSLGTHVETCVATHGRAPNFLLVDFYEYGGGSVFQVAADINGVPYAPTTPVATPVPTTSPSSNSTNVAVHNQVQNSLVVGMSVVSLAFIYGASLAV